MNQTAAAKQQSFALFLLALVVIGTTPGRVQPASAAAARDGSSTVGGDWDDALDEEEGYCAPYNGKVCKSFVNSRQVWYSREDGTGGWENEKITAALFREFINDLPDYCRPAAEVSGNNVV